MEFLTRALRILLWLGVIVFVLGGAGFGYATGGVIGFLIGAVGGFFLAAIIFGTLALLFEIRDILNDIKGGTQTSPAVPTPTLAPAANMARQATSGIK